MCLSGRADGDVPERKRLGCPVYKVPFACVRAIMHKPSGGMVVERIEDRHALGIACVCCVFSFAFLVTGTVFMLIHSDQRVVLTTLDVFHDWAGLQGIFRDTVRYDPAFNPPSLDRARFDSNLAVFQDLHSRGLMTDEVFANVSSQFNISTGMRLEVFDMPFAAMVAQLMSVVGGDFAQVSALLSGVTGGDFAQMSALLNQTMGGILAARGSSMGLLYRLLSLSGCAFPDAIPGQTPVSRSKGCLCIGNAYLDFVRASVNMSSNVSLAVREAGAGTVLRCMDRRVTWRTWGGGRWWSLHPLGIMAYCQFVFFLGCLAFILSFRHEFLFSGKTPQQKTWIVRGILSFFAVCFCVVLAWDNWRGNFFLLLGVLVALSGLAFSVTSVLDYAGRSGAGKGPHPLMVCFWINFPLLLPALVVVVVIAGFTRDVVAVGVVGVMAAVLGLVLQVPSFCVAWVFSGLTRA